MAEVRSPPQWRHLLSHRGVRHLWLRQPDRRVSDPHRGCQARGAFAAVPGAGWQPRRGSQAGWLSGCRGRAGCGPPRRWLRCEAVHART